MKTTNRAQKSQERAVSRELLRSSFVTVLWSAFKAKKSRVGYRLLDLATDTRNNKATVSRWFSSLPNWQIDTMADIADALGVDIEVRAHDRVTGAIYSAGEFTSVEQAMSKAIPVTPKHQAKWDKLSSKPVSFSQVLSQVA